MKRNGHPETELRTSTKLLAALDLMEFGIQLMHQNIRRALPNAAPEIIDAHLQRWLIEQPKDFSISDLVDSSQPSK